MFTALAAQFYSISHQSRLTKHRLLQLPVISLDFFKTEDDETRQMVPHLHLTRIRHTSKISDFWGEQLMISPWKTNSPNSEKLSLYTWCTYGKNFVGRINYKGKSPGPVHVTPSLQLPKCCEAALGSWPLPGYSNFLYKASNQRGEKGKKKKAKAVCQLDFL